MRIITAYSLGNRSASTSTDARLLNGYAEGNEDSLLRSIKRPGLSSSYTVTTGTGTTSTLGQALFSVRFPQAPGVTTFAPLLFAVRGDVLTRGI